MSRTFNMVGGAGGGIKLASIAITHGPNKTSYRPGQTFDPAGMTVEATYSNGAKATATGWTYDPSGPLTEGTESVTILYTEGGVTAQAQQAVTVQKASIAVPTQSGSLTYNGNAQSPTWSGYDQVEMTLGGVTTGTNAGSYNATFTLKDTVGTQWTDGTTEPKTVTWSIGKAAGSVSLNPQSLTLDTDNPTKTITVTRAGTGAISAQSSAPGVASVQVSGTTITVTGHENGDVTVTVNVAADSNYNAASPAQCAVEVSFLKDNFADNEWSEIIAACQSGNVPASWVVGNYKNMTINGKAYRIDIIGKNHDTYASGGTAPLTFQMHDCYDDLKQMNSSDTNNGGWNSCAMRSTHLPAILDLMPAEVKAAIREVQKKTSAGNKSSSIQTTNDKLFLLSEIEIFGRTTYSFAGEGKQYAYYQAGNSKVKKRSGSAYWWWDRSPNSSNSAHFCGVNNSGNADWHSASNSYGVAFGFCF